MLCQLLCYLGQFMLGQRSKLTWSIFWIGKCHFLHCIKDFAADPWLQIHVTFALDEALALLNYFELLETKNLANFNQSDCLTISRSFPDYFNKTCRSLVDFSTSRSTKTSHQNHAHLRYVIDTIEVCESGKKCAANHHQNRLQIGDLRHLKIFANI